VASAALRGGVDALSGAFRSLIDIV